MQDTDNKTIDRIKKLLALAQSPNPNEAAAAFARAQEIATAHRIELSSIAGDNSADSEDPMCDLTIECGKRIRGWRQVLMGRVCKANGVFVCISSGQFILAGTRSNVQTAEYLYHAIVNEIERLALEQRGQGRAFVNSFKLGAAIVVGNRICEQAEQTIEQARQAGSVSETALVKIHLGAKLAQTWYAEKRGDSFRLGSPGKVASSSARGHAAGKEAGKTVDIGGSKRHAVSAGRLALGPAK